jgi:hypothetical protein
MSTIWEWSARLALLISLLMPAGMAWAQGGQGACKPGVNCTVYVGNSDGTANPTGVAVFASFTPAGGLTLSQAAAKLGYIGFDWQQTITNWPNADLFSIDGTPLTPVPSPNPPYLDPPLGGYSYNPCGGPAPGASGGANPFYYNPAPSNDCWSLAKNETTTTLSFGDEPMDPELTPAQIAAGDVPTFTTELVGILPGGMPGKVQFEWTWETTYNGFASTNPASSARAANSPQLQPGFDGTGHVTILSIKGFPIPEPSALFLLASGVLAMLAARKATDWNRT